MAFLTEAANRGSISTGPYQIDNSLVLEDANEESLIRNYSGDGDRRTWTYSTWVKKIKFGSQFDYMYLISAAYTSIFFLNNDLLRVALYNGSSTVYANPSQVFRDGSAWYHIVVTLDSTQGTAADRVKIYINGVRVTEFDSYTTYTNMSQNEEFGVGEAASNYQFGYFFAGGANNRGFSGYVAETHYVNGTALDCTSFGEFDDDTGIWIPKQYTGSHGAKGFYFKFDDASNLGKDSATSGVGDFSENNITAIDQSTDTPTNLFATFNPLYLTVGTYPEGATKYTTNAHGGWKSVYPTMSAENGKWYAEFKHVDAGSKFVGVVPFSLPGVPRGEGGFSYYGSTSNSIGYFNDGNRYINGGAASYGASWTQSDIMSIALDMDNGKVYFAKNGTWQNSGDPTSGATGTGAIDLIEPTQAHAFGPSLYNANTSMLCNYGGFTTISISSAASDANGYGTFEYAPPSGYYALCTKNLAEFG